VNWPAEFGEIFHGKLLALAITISTTTSLLLLLLSLLLRVVYQLDGQFEAPAFEHHHRVAPSDDVSISASDARDEDTDIVGEVDNVRRRVCAVVACSLRRLQSRDPGHFSQF